MGFWPVVENVIKRSDIVVLVADARMPELSRNKEIERKIVSSGKKTILVFNKIDLILPADLQDLRKNNSGAFFVSVKKQKGIIELKNFLEKLGINMNIPEPRVGIVGYPNVGKSSVINSLAERASTAISPIAGTTRGFQWIKVGNLLIIDSPGVIPLEDKNTKLGLIAAKNPEKISYPEKVAAEIINMFLKKSPEALKAHYKLSSDNLKLEAYEVLLEIGKKRGYLMKGGIVDETKTAIQIIREWQTGKLSFNS
ncbi:MAG: GTPase [Nanoarchaeota archaeon]|nr:GTPase [Nanoarchaeota archaeon]